MTEVCEAERPADGAVRSSGAPYDKLRPGPGKPAAEVASHQRSRLQRAMIALASAQGYDAVRVRELATVAGVSSRTFYEHFGGKQECFLATYDFVVRSAARRVLRAQTDGCDVEERVRLTFDALARELADEPEAARLALVEAFAAGPEALERMQRTSNALEAMARGGFAAAPDGTAMPPLVVKGIVAGAGRVACAQLLDGERHEWRVLADELTDWALSFRSEATPAVELLGRDATAEPRPGPAGDGGGDPGGQACRDERALILAATTRLAARGGYRQLSIPEIRALAGVSRKRLDAHFDDVTHCFLAALELLIKQTVMRALRQGATADTWQGGLHRALSAFCAAVARDPAFARLGFIEVFAPGTKGIRFRARLIAAIADRFRRSVPARHRPSELAAEASVGAVLGIVHDQIAAGRSEQLPQVAPTLCFLMLAPAIGAAAAVDSIREEQELSTGKSRCRGV